MNEPIEVTETYLQDLIPTTLATAKEINGGSSSDPSLTLVARI